MTWIKSFYLRALTILLQITLILSDEQGRAKPVIRQPPNDIIVQTNNITVSCLVDGAKPLTIFWQKNGITLDLKKLPHLTLLPDGPLMITNAEKKRDQGRYRCIVSNSVGKVISREAEVIFPYMDKFSTDDIKTISANEGDHMFLKCDAPDSFPDRHIYWTKQHTDKGTRSSTLQSSEDAHYSTNADGNLYFAYTKRADNGFYDCNVENHHLGKYERRSVKVVVKPVVVEENKAPRIWFVTAKKAVRNENYDLECIAFGRPVPTIKIHKVNSDVNLGSRDGNKRIVRFRPFWKSDEGMYVCEASNQFGQKDSRTFYLASDVKPSWLVQPQDTLSDIGDSKTLHCMANGLPSVTYSWYFNAQRLTIEKEYSIAGGNLTISPIERSHSGMYQCSASNIHGALISSARLQVIEIPAGFGQGSTAPSNTHVLIEGMAEISCNPTGSPKPSIRWRNLRTNSEVVSQGRYTILPNGNLRIKRVMKTDHGKYQCIVRNALGSASKEAELFVRASIAITKPPRSTVAKVGTSVNLTCGVETADVLEVFFKWKKNFVKLPESNRVYTRGKGPHTSVLHLDDLRMIDMGIYQCIAMTTGRVGSTDSAEAYLTVTGSSGIEPSIGHGHSPPPLVRTTDGPLPSDTTWQKGVPGRPTEVTTSDFKDRKVRISWTLGRDNYSPVTKVHIQYRTLFEPAKWKHMITTTNTKSRASVVVSLSPWASYRFRVMSENGVGNSTPSSETFPWLKSAPAAPSRYPTGIKSIGTGPTEIKISWNPLPKMHQNGPNIYYNVFHRKSGATSKMRIQQVKFGSSWTVKGTEYYVQYEFSIQAGNDVGLGPMSPIASGFTGERRPLGVPKDLQVQITSSRTAVAWWRGVKTERKVMRGKFLGYKLFFWRGIWPEKGKNSYFKTTRANKTQVQLDPHTSYLFQVVAYNSEGDGPGSNIAGPYKTPEDTPDEPTTITIKDVEMGLANITWTDPLRPNGKVIGYAIRYRTIPDGKVHSLEVEGQRTWVMVRDLVPAALYEFFVAAKTKAGTGRFKKKSFDFTWLPLVKPDGVKVTATGPSTIVLTWNAVNDPGVIGYKLYLRSEDNTTSEDIKIDGIIADKETPIGNLRSGTVYIIQVAAMNHYGAGPKTRQLRVKTDSVPTTPGIPSTTSTTNSEVISTKEQENYSNVIPSSKEKRASTGSSNSNVRTFQFLFWTLTTLILILR